ncbi:MAG: phage tail assembly chaperone [Erythrobacter sp.]|uniref:phage tail assembly chaperone n=1 Tax=Erythrobacter sp. TaxID=1042 RepID=UPI0025D3F4BF|nr:phage tail assembly chaperone [Erythrobacter sp.]MCL9999226.1 phage tail assembly chaperone [Erythrobacter sp.]
MRIFFDANPQDGTVRFFHEAIDGPRQLPTWKSEVEREAGKRPVMVDNPATRIPAGATEISRERFEELMAAQQGGAQIVLSRGKPIAIPRELSPEEHRAARRRRRDQLLAASDWTQLPDSPLSSSERAAWGEYRQQLRDLDMDGEGWPVPPGGSN